ncbi:hypothetical protein F5B18DRAFT_318547 [Nemania serpens]|nr:hypothetical protein F5B18DRAFT_318547 [Nemania serpens]
MTRLDLVCFPTMLPSVHLLLLYRANSMPSIQEALDSPTISSPSDTRLLLPSFTHSLWLPLTLDLAVIGAHIKELQMRQRQGGPGSLRRPWKRVQKQEIEQGAPHSGSARTQDR